MNKRLKVCISLGFLVVVIITDLAALFVFPPVQRSIVLGLTSLAVGSLSLYAGIKQFRVTKGKGVSLPWWKSSSIIGALQLYCMAGLFVITGLAQVMGEDWMGIILGTPFALLTLGLGIYIISLPRTNRTPKQPPADFQQLPPTMQ